MSDNYNDSIAALGVAIAAKKPVLLWGNPGQGKTSVLTQIAIDQNWDIEVILASIREPSDFAGLPNIVDRTDEQGRTRQATSMIAPDWAQRIAESSDAGRTTICVFDEITTATPATQAALLRVALDRVVGDTYLGDDVAIVAAANPPEIAADGWDLAAPMANRFVHLEWDLPASVVRDGFMLGWPEVPIPHVDQTKLAAEIANGRLLVGAFLGHMPDQVTVIPKSSAEKGKAWASPRSWEVAAELYGYATAAGVSNVARRILIVGTVGQASATAFLSYVNELDLPDPEELIKWAIERKADKFVPPTRGDRVYAVGASILSALNNNNNDERWIAVGDLIAVMANANHADIAVAIGKRWMSDTYRINKSVMPRTESLKALTPVMRAAKIIA